MLFSPRIGTNALARLCRRLGTALEAGIDVRTVCAREAERPAGPASRSRLRWVSQAVNEGDSLTEGLAACEDFFPPLVREMTEVGEKTGHLAEIFLRLAEHYEEQIRLRRLFLASITWPMIELAFAILVVGFLIWIMGMIGQRHDRQIDPLGFGLVGNEGLAIYVTFLTVVAAALFFLFHCIHRGVVWTDPIQRAVLSVPVLGKALETICLARVAWSLHLTMDAGMPLRQALPLSLRSARNARYTGHIPSIDATITSGSPIHEAFAQTGGYPREFLDTIQVGEQTGNLVESMGHLSRQYHERAAAALETLTKFAGFGVWVIVAALITVVIFQIFIRGYLGLINEALEL